MIGETFGHYRIVEKIGEGGMGEVYRAHDERLDRDVAVKVLHEAVAQDADRLARFEREAKAVAKLDHPNILAIHELGTHQGAPFIVTELLDGQSLRQCIPASGMPWQKVVEIGAAIADGLAAAHGKGIVHRDLKPENVFITSDGRVKILDFGLAQVKVPVEEEAETATLTPAGTAVGTIMGTMGYMSPEQLRGEPSDARSDIFALGCVLYEMLSGQTAFLRNSTAETTAAILKEEPASLSDSGTTLPAELERTIRRCLEKSPDARFQSASDLAFNLQSVGTGPAVPVMATSSDGTPVAAGSTKAKKRTWLKPAVAAVAIAVAVVVGWGLLNKHSAPGIPEVKHIAVLPFEAVGDDLESQFLAAGLAETVADGLTIMERETRGTVWVVRPSPDLTIEEARKTHNATILILGIVEHSDERLRLDLQLVESVSGRTLDRRTMDESVSNLTGVQEKPVLLVWEMLGLEATSAALNDLGEFSTNTATASQTYILGRGRLTTADDEGELRATVTLLEQSVEEDPGYYPARVALARASALLFNETRNEGWKERAIAEAKYAMGLDEDAAEPHTVLGGLYGFARDTDLQLKGHRRAAALAQTVDPHYYLGLAATYAGNFEEAERALQTAISLRPDWAGGHNTLGYLYVQMGRYDAAANEFRHAARAAPENVKAHSNLGGVLSFQGRREEAMKAFEDTIALAPEAGDAYSNLGTLYFEEARFGDATEMFEKALELAGDDMPDDDYFLVGNLAATLYWSGKRERAKIGFARAIELAESFLERNPDNTGVMADLASYHAMVGNRQPSIELLEEITHKEIRDAYFMREIAEIFEDLGDRDRAIEWIGKALESGLSVDTLDGRPSFNRLREDDRFKSMLEEYEVE